MQHLLDFIHKNSLEQQLYLVVEAGTGPLSLTWQRQAETDDLWEVQPVAGDEPAEHVHSGDLLDHLEGREVDLADLERELRAVVLTHVAVADVVLRDAKQVLGPAVLQSSLFELRSTALKLSAAEGRVRDARPSLTLIPGEAVESSARIGQLTLVR
jgi:hypothetical protein